MQLYRNEVRNCRTPFTNGDPVASGSVQTWWRTGRDGGQADWRSAPYKNQPEHNSANTSGKVRDDKTKPRVVGIDDFAFRKGKPTEASSLIMKPVVSLICFQTERLKPLPPGFRKIRGSRRSPATEAIHLSREFPKERRKRKESSICLND